MRIHLRRVAKALVDLPQAPNSGEVLGRRAQHGLELLARGIQVAGLYQRAAQRDARRQIRGMPLKAGDAGFGRFVIPAEAPVLLRERRKRNRRRVGLDPASQFL
ncbi:MAG TPA: hypothetical protein VFZ98_01225 [Vicinamibacterales bacterium]